MARVARKISDKRLLRLIRRYLQSGVMIGGIVEPRSEGTPQGGPLSPLLSNILLDDLDKNWSEEDIGLAATLMIAISPCDPRQAGERVLESLKGFLTSDCG